MVKGIIEDIRSGNDTALISSRFHQTLIEIIVDVARLSQQTHIVLTGGCFQNKWLIEKAVIRLRQEGLSLIGPPGACK